MRTNRNSGFSLIELLISTVILFIFVLAIGALANEQLTHIRLFEQREEIQNYLSFSLEKLRNGTDTRAESGMYQPEINGQQISFFDYCRVEKYDIEGNYIDESWRYDPVLEDWVYNATVSFIPISDPNCDPKTFIANNTNERAVYFIFSTYFRPNQSDFTFSEGLDLKIPNTDLNFYAVKYTAAGKSPNGVETLSWTNYVR